MQLDKHYRQMATQEAGMAIDVEAQQKRFGLADRQAPRSGCGLLVKGIVVFGALALIAAFVLTVLDAEYNHDHLAIYAAASLILAGLSGMLLCLHGMLADRAEFYRRGQMEGWRRGWVGQPPELDDPLTR